MGNFFFSILLLLSYTYTHMLGVRWMARRTGWMMCDSQDLTLHAVLSDGDNTVR